MKINQNSIYYGDQTSSTHLVEDISKNWLVVAENTQIQSDNNFYEILEVHSLTKVEGTVYVTSFKVNGNSLDGFQTISKSFTLDNLTKSAGLFTDTPLNGISLSISYSLVNNTLAFWITVDKTMLGTEVEMRGLVYIHNMTYAGGALPRLDLTGDSNIFNEKVVVDKLQIRDTMSLKYKKIMYGSTDSYKVPVTGLYILRSSNTNDPKDIDIIYLTAGSSYVQSGYTIWLLAELK